MPHLAMIRKLEAVEPLTDEEKAAASSLCTDVRSAPRRRDIVSIGDRPEHVHVMLEGWAARYSVLRNGSRRITALMLPGDFCDLHVTSLEAFDHGILALDACRVAYIKASAIEAIIQSTPALTRAFWRATLVDEAILRQWLVNAGRTTAYERIGHLLCELHLRAKLVGLTADDSLSVPLTQDDVADATGLTPVHVNRVLRRLREEGVVTLHRGDMRIPDVQVLREVCGFNPAYLHLRRREPNGG